MALIRSLLLCLALVLPGLAAAQDTSAPAGDQSTAPASTPDDADLAVRMREILGEIGGYEDVTVVVRDGVLTLRGTANSFSEVAALEDLAGRVDGVVAVKNEVTETTDLRRRLDPAIDRFMTRIDQLIVALPIVLIAVTVFGLVAFIGTRVARLRQPWDRLAPNAFIANLYRQIVRLVFVLAGIVIALDIMNATALLGTILGAAGIIGLAIGFAVRDTVENFIASVLLSIRQPFRPNDTVEINGDLGKVIRLTGRATILLNFDGNHIRIPNSTVFKSRIMNYSQNRESRFKFTICVDPACDIAQAKTLATDTVQALPFVIAAPAASSWIENITDSGIEIVITGWIDQTETSLLQARGEALRQVKLAYGSAGIEIPDTTYRIRLEGAAGAELPTAPAQAPAPTPESTAVEAVDPAEDDALERIVAAERASEDAPDLLHDQAPHE